MIKQDNTTEKIYFYIKMDHEANLAWLAWLACLLAWLAQLMT